MNEHDEKKIDRLLGDWSSGERADLEHLDRLAERIKSAIDAHVAPDPQYGPLTAPLPATNAGWRTPLTWFSLGVAASVLVTGLGIAWFVAREKPIVLPESAESTAFAQIDAGQIHNRATLFRELNDFYAGNLAWMAEVDGRVVLRVDSSKIGSPSSPVQGNVARERSVTVRVVVVARAAGDERWQTLWKADVMAENDQFVQIGPSDGAKHDLSVWAHMLPDGSVAVDTSISLEAGNQDSYSGVQRPSVPERILTRKAGNVEYRVFQTVAVLPEKVG